jgi:hypothetical protein
MWMQRAKRGRIKGRFCMEERNNGLHMPSSSSDVSPFVPPDRSHASIDIIAGQILLRLAFQAGNVGDAHNVVVVSSQRVTDPIYRSERCRSTCMSGRASLTPSDKHIYHDPHR